MKSIKLFIIGAAFCAISAVGYNVYTNATMTEEERLMQANLEALMDSESAEAYSCFKGVYDSGQDGYVLIVTLCSTCTSVYAEQAWDASYCQ